MTTAAELLCMPGGRVRRELVRGKLREYPLRGAREGAVATDIMVSLGTHVQENDLGDVYANLGCQLASEPDTVLSAPISFARHGRWPADSDTGDYPPGAPDLAIEIVSLGDNVADLETKALDWLDAGCRMVVVVNPRRRAATVYHSRSDVTLLTERDELDGGDVVPGRKLPLRDVFG